MPVPDSSYYAVRFLMRLLIGYCARLPKRSIQDPDCDIAHSHWSECFAVEIDRDPVDAVRLILLTRTPRGYWASTLLHLSIGAIGDPRMLSERPESSTGQRDSLFVIIVLDVSQAVIPPISEISFTRRAE